jgi:hypothetical protein
MNKLFGTYNVIILAKIKTMKTLNLKTMKLSAIGILIATVISSTAIANDIISSDYNSESAEEIEVLDSWMTDLSSWNTQKSFAFETDMEEEIILESWMIHPDSEIWVSDQEEELEIEDWMTTIADSFKADEESEENLTLEAWMLNPTKWLQ